MKLPLNKSGAWGFLASCSYREQLCDMHSNYVPSFSCNSERCCTDGRGILHSVSVRFSKKFLLHFFVSRRKRATANLMLADKAEALYMNSISRRGVPQGPRSEAGCWRSGLRAGSFSFSLSSKKPPTTTVHRANKFINAEERQTLRGVPQFLINLKKAKEG